jgi:hypothetical protein
MLYSTVFTPARTAPVARSTLGEGDPVQYIEETVMFEVNRLVSWNCSTEQLPATVEFYRSLFGDAAVGEPAVERRSDGTELTIARLTLADLSIGFYDWPGGRRPSWDHHTFEVAWPGEPEIVTAVLEREGVQVEGLRRHAGGQGYSMVLRDPAGNRVELSTTR